MADLKVNIRSEVDKAVADMQKFRGELNTLKASHNDAASAALTHASAMEKAGTGANAFSGAVKGMTTAISGAMAATVALGAALVGAQILFAFVNLVKSTEEFNLNLYKLTENMNGNAQAASAWNAVSMASGMAAGSMSTVVRTLSKDMEGNNKVFAETGIAYKDAGGNLLDLNSVLLSSADYFHAHTTASNNATIAATLFGRNVGQELLPALMMGRDGIAQITAKAQELGLILDRDTISRNMAFTAQLHEAQFAVQALAIGIGNALLPGIAALALGLEKLIVANLPAFIAAIQRVVSYVVGLIEGLTGMKLAVDQNSAAFGELAGATGTDYGQAADSGAASSKALQDAMRDLRAETKATTTAIQDQIDSLNKQDVAFQKTINDQIASVTEAAQLESFTNKQTKIRESAADKAVEIERLRQEAVLKFYLGDFVGAKAAQVQLDKAREDAAQLAKDLAQGVTDEDRRLAIEGLKDTQTTHKDATKLLTDALAEQKQAVQAASDAQLQAMQDAAGKMVSTMAGAGAAIGTNMSSATTDMMNKFKFAVDTSAEATGKSMGEKLITAFQAGDYRTFATAIGETIGEGIVTGLGAGVTKAIDRAGASAWDSLKQKLGGGRGDGSTGQSPGSLLPSNPNGPYGGASGRASDGFADGGIVPGPMGAPVSTTVHGGEAVLSTDQIGQMISYLAQIAQNGQPATVTGSDALVQQLVANSAYGRSRGIVAG